MKFSILFYWTLFLFSSQQIFDPSSPIRTDPNTKIISTNSTSGESQKRKISGVIDKEVTIIDGKIKDVQWCGTNKEVIFLTTTENILYKSIDKGITWRNLNPLFKRLGYMEMTQQSEVNI